MMYEDTLESKPNAFRRAIRKRAQKGVAFADPMYQEAPAYMAYSDEEEEEEFDENLQGDVEDNTGQNGVEHGDDPDQISSGQVNSAHDGTNGTGHDEDDVNEMDYDGANDELGERSKLNIGRSSR
jgi:hypothetical protein